MRFCSSANGRGAPSCHATISPSMHVPSGSRAPSAAISGKRSVTSSSPRDHSHDRRRRARRAARGCRPTSIRHASRRGGPSVAGSAFELVREEERIRLARVAASRRPRARSSAQERVRVGLPRDVRVADQAVRDGLRVDARVRGERARDEEPRHADAEAAGDQLVQHEPLRSVELVPVADQPRLLIARRISAAQRRAARSSTHSASAAVGSLRRGGSTCAMRLGEIADRVVALLEQPRRRGPPPRRRSRAARASAPTGAACRR